MIYKTNNPDGTYKVAREFAKNLKAGDVITLDGDLGAGKTAFTRGVAEGLGITDAVVSPTFTVVNEYVNGKIPLFHFDVYRIDSSDDLYDIGWEDYLNRDGIIMVEWASVVEDIFDMPVYKITITKNPDISYDYREIEITYKEQ